MDQISQDWEVRTIDDLDPQGLQLVADFFNEQYPGVFYPKCTPQIFEWKLGPSNPAGTGFITVAINGGKVIGVFTLTRKTMMRAGIRIKVGEIGDAYTHPKFRRGGRCVSPNAHLGESDEYYQKSIFGRLVAETLFRAKLNGVQFVYGTPNAVAKPSYIKRLGFLECDEDKIFSKYLLTKFFQNSNLLISALRSLCKLNYFYSRLMLQFRMGVDSINRVPSEEVFNELVSNKAVNPKGINQLEMSIDTDYILHRYINHPTMEYSFYRVGTKEKVFGYVIATEIVRASGIRTLVISDWVTFNTEFTKKFPLILGCMRNFSRNAETISLWQSGRTPKYNLLLSGLFSGKRVSIVGKSLEDQTFTRELTFSDFRFGWSDNG